MSIQKWSPDARSGGGGQGAGGRPRPIVTFLTDFGERDAFVGSMKGMVLARCRDACLVDLTHAVPPFDILGGSLLLRSAAPSFPPGAIHVAVVDPGVGSARRPLVVRADDHLFVAPDNGLLSHVLEAATAWQAWTITEPSLLPPAISRTFHGRDVFGPVAGLLGSGLAPERVGPPATDLRCLPLPRPLAGPGGLQGEVVWIDGFGNCITNISLRELAPLEAGGPRRLRVLAGGRPVPGPVDCYADAPPRGSGCLIGSGGCLELFVREGSFAAEWGIGRGAMVEVAPQPAR